MKSRENLGWFILSVEIGLAGLITLVIWWFFDPLVISGSATSDPTDDTILSWHILWGILSGAYILASIRVWDPVPPDRIGVRIIVGIATDTVTAGPPVVPPLVGEIELFPTATVQREFPDEPEKIFRAPEEGDQTPPPGMKPPLRINFSDSLKKEDLDTILGTVDRFPEDGGLRWIWRPGAITQVEKDAIRTGQTAFDPVSDPRVIWFNPHAPDDGLSSRRITAEVSHISRFKIYNAVAFVQTIPLPENGNGNRIDEAFRQLEDEQVVALNSVLTKISVGQAQANVEWMNAILFARVETRIKAVDGHSDSWGIDLEGATLKPYGFNRSLNKAITKAGEAQFNKTTTITDAEASKQKLILEGAGTATAARDLTQKTLEGQGKGLKAAALATGLTPEQILASDVAKTIGSGEGNVIIGADGLATLAAAGGTIVNSLPKKP